MTTQEKRNLMIELVVPFATEVDPDNAQRYLEMLTNADAHYIEDNFARFFAHYETEPGIGQVW